MSDRERIDLRECVLSDVARLFEAHHGYKSVGRIAVYCFAVIEDGAPVAAFVWSPPPPGAAKQLSSAPGGAGVLALSRMVAVPRSERRLQKISKALRRQMRDRVDRGRWPVLVTYSDASLGHTGHVYRCSGWTQDGVRRAAFSVGDSGERRSRYANGKASGLAVVGVTELTRWVHRACPAGTEAEWLERHGWRREAIPGKKWSSGAEAYRWVLA
jgi:hypothetical protein